MITLQQILRSQSDILDHARVKIVRHKDGREEYREAMKEKASIIEYQKRQEKNVFKDCDYIVSFKGIERNQALMLGVFKVLGCKPFNEKTYDYDLEVVPEFESLTERVIINWDTRIWHVWYDKSKPKEVVEILPKGYIGNFPGLFSVVLDFRELETLVNHPDANFEWKYHLSSVNGVYMILDTKTGQQYIGSANGEKGIWQRWCDYARNKTGDNKELKTLLAEDPAYYKNFRFSILQTLPSNITKNEIVAIESLYKQKFGSRVHGLNDN